MGAFLTALGRTAGALFVFVPSLGLMFWGFLTFLPAQNWWAVAATFFGGIAWLVFWTLFASEWGD